MAKEILSSDEIFEHSVKLANTTDICFLGSLDEEGYPNIKCVFKGKNNDLDEMWFSTGTSSVKTSQIESNNKTCVYFVDFDNFAGLMLLGRTTPRRDSESRHLLWNEGDDMYYPLGVDDPDYTVLHFIVESGRYYFRGRWPSFKIPYKKNK